KGYAPSARVTRLAAERSLGDHVFTRKNTSPLEILAGTVAIGAGIVGALWGVNWVLSKTGTQLLRESEAMEDSFDPALGFQFTACSGAKTGQMTEGDPPNGWGIDGNFHEKTQIDSGPSVRTPLWSC
ncbi:hypothetical protein, partial [Streptomyces djakartensis]|uniref:hypothetical protein n=1 Tax=Streptomyces djakartensis TaxID=68193 RepID=UPI001E4789A7